MNQKIKSTDFADFADFLFSLRLSASALNLLAEAA